MAWIMSAYDAACSVTLREDLDYRPMTALFNWNSLKARLFGFPEAADERAGPPHTGPAISTTPGSPMTSIGMTGATPH